MNWRSALGAGLAAGACWPAWHALALIAERDYLAASLALGLVWVLARAGVELTMLAERPPEPR